MTAAPPMQGEETGSRQGVALFPTTQAASERAFTARRVPDFARLHALEEARVARWKRQASVYMSVMFIFS